MDPVAEEVNEDKEDIQPEIGDPTSEKLKFHVLHQTRQLIAIIVLMNDIPYAVQTNINHFSLK